MFVKNNYSFTYNKQEITVDWLPYKKYRKTFVICLITSHEIKKKDQVVINKTDTNYILD